ncbi:MAG: hypothetical protein KGN02_06935 [bacterium]|nr:hypothetical protein [bacterium]
MIAFAALLAAVVPVGLGIMPTPAPTPPPVITTIESRAVCTALRKTVIPVAFIAKHNDAAFHDVVLRAANVGQSMLSDKTDYEFLARHDQSDVGAVLTNMDLAQKLLDQSKARYPDAAHPYVAAMRAELENVLYYQKQYNSLVDAISGEYLDAQSNKNLYGGFYGSNTSEVQQRNILAKQDFINGNRALMGLPPLDGLPLGNGAAAAASYQEHRDQSRVTGSSVNGGPSVLDRVRSGLTSAESELAHTAVAAQRMCTAPPTKR